MIMHWRLIAMILPILLTACSGPRYYPPVKDHSAPAQPSQQLPRQVMEIVPLTTLPPALQLGNKLPDNTPTETPTVPLATSASDQQAVTQLLQGADQLQRQGREEEAIIQVKRAMRVTPREPAVYARLAALQLNKGQFESAEQVAHKGLGMAAGQANYAYFFWKLIAACRRLLGDAAGESHAIDQAQQYQ